MSLKGENTKLFDQAREELLDALPNIETFHLSTHDDNFRNLNADEFKSWLYNIDYTSKTLDFNAIVTKTQSLFNKNTTSVKEIVVLSDFQTFEETENLQLDSDFNYRFIKYKAQQQINFSIDTAYILNSADENSLKFEISASEKTTRNIPVSLYDGRNLLSKFSMQFENESQKGYTLNLENNQILNGRISIEDSGLTYDNTLFLSLSKPDPINVLIISEKPTTYLDKIYDNERFNIQQTLINNLEYADISQTDVLILNELQQISNALRIAVENYVDRNAVLGIIPGKEINLSTYNDLFNAIGLRSYEAEIENSIKLTNINFSHPIFENVFTKSVQNFDYPTFDAYYQSQNPQKALSFSNGLAFLESRNQTFRFNANISDKSNFKQSPLVVLSFYNLALQAQSKSALYAQIGGNYELKLKTDLNQDEVLSLSQGEDKFIPRQEVKGQNTNMKFLDYPEKSGHYVVTNPQNDTLTHLAFNQNRKESRLNFMEIQNIEGIKRYNRFSDFAEEFSNRYETQSLWQWFIVFALIFMIIELLLLRFIK